MEVTMWVPDPKVLDLQRPAPFREGRDLAHDVPACSEGAKGVPGGVASGQSLIHSCFCCGGGGGGGSTRSAPLFPGTHQGTSPRPAPSLCGG